MVCKVQLRDGKVGLGKQEKDRQTTNNFKTKENYKIFSTSHVGYVAATFLIQEPPAPHNSLPSSSYYSWVSRNRKDSSIPPPHTHTHTHTCTHTRTHTHTQTHTHTHARTHAHTHARTHARTHTHTPRVYSCLDLGPETGRLQHA